MRALAGGAQEWQSGAMWDWAEFILALGLFIGSHPLPKATGLKAWLTARIGRRGYLILYSVVSVLLFSWVIVAVSRAPYIGLWDQAQWQRVMINIAMPVAIFLGTFGIAAPNPFAFEGRRSGFDPERPGIAGVTRQPFLWSMALWSGAHTIVNGDLAHFLVFGPLFLFATGGLVIADRVARRRLGAEWGRLAAHTGLVPFAALVRGRWRPKALPSLPRLALAVLLWVGIWHAHAPVIGAWPGFNWSGF